MTPRQREIREFARAPVLYPPPAKAKKPPPRRGNCYVTCEALYHLLGGKEAGWVPHTVRVLGDVHWYLVRKINYHLGTPGTLETNQVLDPTASQFPEGTTVDYDHGRARGFLTKAPSKRARDLMEKLLWQEEKAGPERFQGK